MMSLTETNLLSIVKKQYRYKSKANAGVFFNLIAAQMLAFLFSLNGVVIISTFRIPLNKTRQVIGLYLALLLVSVTVFYAIAEPGEPVPMPTPEETDNPWEEHDRKINTFYYALFEDRIEEYEGAYKQTVEF